MTECLFISNFILHDCYSAIDKNDTMEFTAIAGKCVWSEVTITHCVNDTREEENR